MKIVYCENYDVLSKKAADLIAAQVLVKPDCVLGLATGSSPVGAYKELIAKYNAGDLDFSKCKSINLDEYVGLDETNENSYVYFMRDNLFNHVNIDLANTNVPNGMNADAENECARYDALIDAHGGIDLQLLGIGVNGHIGFNEPCDEFKTGTHCVELEESTIEANKRFFEDISQVPRKAYTMGIKAIMNAKKVVLVANGKNKADIICAMATGPVTPQVPASILQLHGDVTIFADAEALSVLKEKAPQLISGLK